MSRIYFALPSMFAQNARNLKKSLSDHGIELTLTRTRDLLAIACGYRTFQEFSAVTRTASHPPTPWDDVRPDAAAAAEAFGLDSSVVATCMDGLFRPSDRSRLLADAAFANEMAWIRRKVGMALSSAIRQGAEAVTITNDGPGAACDVVSGQRTDRQSLEYLGYPDLDLNLFVSESGAIDAASVVCTQAPNRFRGSVIEDVEPELPHRWYQSMISAVLGDRGQGETNDLPSFPAFDATYGLPDRRLDFVSIVVDAMVMAGARRGAGQEGIATIDLPFTPQYQVRVSIQENSIRVAPAGPYGIIDFARGIVQRNPFDSVGRARSKARWTLLPEISHLLEPGRERRPAVVCYGDRETVEKFLRLRQDIEGAGHDPVPPTWAPDRASAYRSAFGLRSPDRVRPMNITILGVEKQEGRFCLDATRFADLRNEMRTFPLTRRIPTARERQVRHHPTVRQAADPLQRICLTQHGRGALERVAAEGCPTAVLSIMLSGDDIGNGQWRTCGMSGPLVRDGIIMEAARRGGETASRHVDPHAPSHDTSVTGDPAGIWHIWTMEDCHPRKPGSTIKVAGALPKDIDDIRVVLSFDVATLCPHCCVTEADSLRSENELEKLASIFDENQRAGIRHLNPGGCPECEGTAKSDIIKVVDILTADGYQDLSGTSVPLIPDLRQLALAGRVDPAPFIGMQKRAHW